MSSDMIHQARALVGRALPALSFPSTAGARVDLSAPAQGDLVVFIFPRLSRPGQPDAEAWALIPGAKGCTVESCEFRDLAANFDQIGFRILGLSTQHTDEQQEAVDRLHLPYPLLSDPELQLAHALGLPTFAYGGDVLYVRSTFIIREGVIVRAELGITDAAAHPRDLLRSLQDVS